MSRIDIILVNYNGCHFLEECLNSMRQQTFKDFTIWIIDNGSSDGSESFVKKKYPEVKWVGLQSNTGFCYANNHGIALSNSEFIFLLNNDTVLDKETLAELINTLDTYLDVDFCSCKLVHYQDSNIIDTIGDDFTFYGVARKQGSGKLSSHYNVNREVFGACAGAAIYRRAMLEVIGGFDEDFWAYNEDSDLNFRARVLGYKCLFVAKAVVKHHVGGSFKKSPRKQYLIRRNLILPVWKNMPMPLLCFLLPICLIYWVMGDLRCCLNGGFLPVFRARYHNWKAQKQTNLKRIEIQKKRKLSSLQTLKILSF